MLKTLRNSLDGHNGKFAGRSPQKARQDLQRAHTEKMERVRMLIARVSA